MSRQIERSIVKAAIQHRPIWTMPWVAETMIGTGIFSILYLFLQLV